MLAIGSYRFSLSTAAYNQLERAANWRWPSQDVIRALPVRQWVGPGDRTLKLSGLVLPHYRSLMGFGNLVSRLPIVPDVISQLAGIGDRWQSTTQGLPFSDDPAGRWQLDGLRADAERGIPLLVVDGRGRNWGYWVVENLTERASDYFLNNGGELHVAFDVSLSYYGTTPDAAGDFSDWLIGFLRNILGL
jgi:phage protein U